MKRAGGFTLIELLVAITVLAVVAVLGWRGLDSIIRAREGLNLELEQTRGLQLSFAQMQNDADKIATSATVGGRPVLDLAPSRLTLVRMVYADNQPSQVQVVSYQLSAGGVLTRRESLPTRELAELNTAWMAALAGANQDGAVVLQHGVQEMGLRSWAPNVGWLAAGAPMPPNTAATGVEVRLALRDRPGNMVKLFLLGAA